MFALAESLAAGLRVVLDDGDARYIYGATGLISQVTVADTYYYLPDGLGSTMVTTNSAGNVANAYTYDVFGAPRSQSGAQTNEFQFAGEQVDGSTGLQYLRARYYDFETGRFISREPLAASPGWGESGYGYARANPLRLVDRDGLRPVDADGCELGHIGCDRIRQTPPVPECATECWYFGTQWICEREGSPAPSRLIPLAKEYVRDILAGCRADPDLCAVAFGSVAVSRIIQAAGAVTIAVGCSAGGPAVCLFAVVVGGTEVATGQLLTHEMLSELRSAGREARMRERRGAGGRDW